MANKQTKKGRTRGTLSDFVALDRSMMRSGAWRSLLPVARAIYLEIAYHYRGDNNGRIVVSLRRFAEILGISKNTACRALKDLQARGFLDIVKAGAFSMKSRHASEVRLTARRCDVTGALPSRRYEHWKPDFQKPVPSEGPNGATTGTEARKTTRHSPLRSLSSNRRSPFDTTDGIATGTPLNSTMGGVAVAVSVGEQVQQEGGRRKRLAI